MTYATARGLSDNQLLNAIEDDPILRNNQFVAELVGRFSELKDEFEAAEKALEAADKNVESLEHDLEEAHRETEAAQASYDEIYDEVESLRAQLENHEGVGFLEPNDEMPAPTIAS